MNPRETRPDLLVIGAGAIGCATALECAHRGLAVTVLERGTPGREATWAAAGMLAPLAEASGPSPFLDLSLASLERWPGFADALADATGLDVEYRAAGKLQIAWDEEGEQRLAAAAGWQRGRGLGSERLAGNDARSLEPALSDDVRAALRIPRDHRVDNRRLGRALWLAAERAGARFRRGAEATRLLARDGRVRGVELAGGERVLAERVLIAAGSWSGVIDGLPRRLPVFPVRGQMAALEAVPPPIQHTILSPGCYLVPRADGRVLVGATVECAGFRAHPTPAGVGALLRAAVRAAPALADVPIVECWAGLRPGTPDELPILGPDPALDGLLYATGHFRNGILLTPITAEIIADVVTGEPPALPIEPFAPDRFAEESAPE